MIILTILGIIGAVVILGIASLAILPNVIGALIPTAVGAIACWFVYRLVRKGCRKWKNWTDK